jgi:hypothetical protein
MNELRGWRGAEDIFIFLFLGPARRHRPPLQSKVETGLLVPESPGPSLTQGCDDRDCLIARSRPRSLFRDRDSDRDELKKTRPGPGSHD